MSSEELGIYPVERYIKLERNAQQWIVQDIIPVAGLTNLYSSPKCGKTMLTMHLAMAVADPKTTSYLGLPVNTHGKVLYLELDTPRNQWAFRLERALKEHPIPPGTLFTADRLTCPKNFNITAPEHLSWLRHQVEQIEPIMVLIDTLREVNQSDEDNATAMKQVMSCVLEAIPNSAIVFLSHSRKTMQGMTDEIGSIIDDARGSGYIAGKMDSIIKITKRILAYQTRAGKGEFAIQQDPKTGEIRRLFNDKTLNEFIRYNIERNPDFTRDQQLKLILETTDISSELAAKRYDSLKNGQEQDSGGQDNKPPPSPDLEKALKALKNLDLSE